MTFDRFSDYVKTAVAGGVFVHLFINILLIDTILGHPELVAKPFPIALPLGLLGAFWGWSMIYRSPAPPKQKAAAMALCPCCGTVVRADRIKDCPPVEAG